MTLMGPIQNFFKTILATLNHSIADVKVLLFTGSLTRAKKTDFHFEYKGTDNNYHHYFRDFVIVKNTGEFHIRKIGIPSYAVDQKKVENLLKMPYT